MIFCGVVCVLQKMDKFTFSDGLVRNALTGFGVLQVDVTENSVANKALLKRFSLFGPPAIVFFAKSSSNEMNRVIGFQNAEAFLPVLNSVVVQSYRFIFSLICSV